MSRFIEFPMVSPSPVTMINVDQIVAVEKSDYKTILTGSNNVRYEVEMPYPEVVALLGGCPAAKDER